ncbi:MAG: hypothetical protein KA116_01565 [Proteobacteria bacterium]|nr:hypothetical protein [Pseudomonadota bacterium]
MALKIRILIVLMLFISLTANFLWADGFICESPQGYLRIKIFHHTSFQTGGTRKVAVMVLSNPRVPMGKRTIGVFNENKGTLIRDSSSYFANFDFRFKGLYSKPQEFIKDISKKDIQSLEITPNFNINEPIAPSAKLKARFKLSLRSGQDYQGWIDCIRYLKQKQRKKPKKTCAKKLEPPAQGELRL